MKNLGLFLIACFSLASCKKSYSGHCVSGTNQSDYQILSFSEQALTKSAAERKVEKVLNDKFQTSTDWNCSVND